MAIPKIRDDSTFALELLQLTQCDKKGVRVGTFNGTLRDALQDRVAFDEYKRKANLIMGLDVDLSAITAPSP